MNMKRIYSISILLFLVFSGSLLQGQEYKLTVQNGLGSGTYKKGEYIEIIPQIPVSKVFKSWTGDSMHVENLLEEKTSVIMPDKEITVTPTFSPAPAGTYSILGNISGDLQNNVKIRLYDSTNLDYSYTATDASGNYSFSGLSNGLYSVNIILDELYTSDTNFIYVTVNNANIADINFETKISGKMLKGAIYNKGNKTPLPGTIIKTNDGHYTVSNLFGFFEFKNLSIDTTYTFTPELQDYTFTPENKTIKTKFVKENENCITEQDPFLSFEGEKYKYILTVIDGKGSGSYTIDTSVNISPDIPTAKVFSKWTGDTDFISNPNIPNTTIKIPAKNISIKAEFIQAPENTYTISGEISGDIKQGVVVSADSEHSAITDKNGKYTINGLSNGDYTITPALEHYSFSPASTVETISDANEINVDFNSTSLNYTITGKVINEDGSGLAGVEVALNTGDSTTTDSNGNFLLSNIQNGKYNISCSLADFSFTPQKRYITVNNKDITGIFFSNTQAYTLNVENGNGSGQYSKGAWTYITPKIPVNKVFAGWTGDIEYIQDPSIALRLLNMPPKNITLTATFEDAPPNTYKITGTLYGQKTANVVLYAKKDRDLFFTTTDESGNFVIEGLPNGIYSINILLGVYSNVELGKATINSFDKNDVKLLYNGKKFEGTIKNEYNEPIPGLLLSDNYGHYVTTDSNGKYSFINLTEETYIITPNASEYTFTPSSISISKNYDAMDLDFTGYKIPKYTLTVLDSYGNGRYLPNQKIDISANIPQGFEFNSWTGDTLYVNNINSASTYIIMPAKNILLIPTFSPVQQNTFTLKGKITGSKSAGIAIKVDKTHSTVTDDNGNYIISGLTDGETYHITPQLQGYTFTPASTTLTIAAANENGIDFTALDNDFSITGTLLDESGNGVDGITFTTGSNTGTTDAQGHFSIDGLSNGTYKISATSPLYEINPNNLEITINGKNTDNLYFIAKKLYSLTVNNGIGTGMYVPGTEIEIVPTMKENSMFIFWDGENQFIKDNLSSKTTLIMPSKDINISSFTADTNPGIEYTISGHFTAPEQEGIVLELHKLPQNVYSYTASDSNGNYYFSGLGPGTYYITPKTKKYSYTPGTYNVAISSSNAPNKDFTTADTAINISGSIKENSSNSLGGVFVSDGKGHSTLTHVNSGFFNFKNIETGDYKITPSLPGYTFNPAYQTLSVSDNDVYIHFQGIPDENHLLTVINGNGSGEYHLNEMPAVSAKVPAGTIFTHWTGDVEYLTDVNKPYSTILMPNKDITLQAEFQTPTQSSFTVSGKISGDKIEGITIFIDSRHSSVTDADGYYSISGLKPGIYNLAPIVQGYISNPLSEEVIISNSNVENIDFNILFSGFKISGKIFNELASDGLSGVLVSTTSGFSDITDSNGSFSLTGLKKGLHTLNFSLAGYEILPSSLVVEINDKDLLNLTLGSEKKYQVTINGGIGSGLYIYDERVKITATSPEGMEFLNWSGDTEVLHDITDEDTSFMSPKHDITLTANFSPATAGTYTVTGSVSGSLKENVKINISGNRYLYTTTDQDGKFFLSGLANGSYNVKIVSDSLVISTPAEYSFEISNANVNGIDFYTTENGINIKGQIKNNLPGVMVKVDDTHFAYTDLSGKFTITGLQKNSEYRVVPELNGYKFTPEFKIVYLLDYPVDNIDFEYKLNSPHSLIVNNGTGSCNATENQKVNVNAEVPDNYIFKQWIGDIQYLDNPLNAAAIVTMPAKNITLTAEFSLPKENTFSLSGKISSTSGLNINKILLTTDSGENVFTDKNGNFTILGLQNGTYKITPQISGCSSSPEDYSVVINNADANNVNFNLSFTGYSISGKIIDSENQPLKDITLTVDSTTSETTDSNGYYKFSGLTNGYHTIISSSSDRILTPEKSEVFINNKDVSDINFLGKRKYNLTVNNGLGSGEYSKNEKIQIFPENQDGYVFSEWTGDIQYLDNPSEQNTSVTMPPMDISLTPIFTNPPAGTFNARGAITGNIADDIVIKLINLSDSSVQYTATQGGAFSFSGLTNGNYQILPDSILSKIPYRSIPSSSSFTISNADVNNLTFETLYIAYSIKGYIQNSDQTPIPGVLISADAQHQAVSNENGIFEISGLSNGTYTLIPRLNGYTFTPDRKSLTISNSSISFIEMIGNKSEKYSLTVINGSGSAQYYQNEIVGIATAVPDGMIFKKWVGDTFLLDDITAPNTTLNMPAKNITVKATFLPAPTGTFSLKGKVSGSISEGVFISLDTGESTMTDSNGNFSISGLNNASYTVTAELNGYSFSPQHQSAEISNSNTDNINFTSTLSGYSVSGTVFDKQGAPLEGVTISADSSHSAVTDSDGNFIISSLPAGAYIIIPEKTGLMFSPNKKKIILNNKNFDGLYFMSEDAYKLTVENGSGSGYYKKGEYVRITPIVPHGMTFSNWSGDVDYLTNSTTSSFNAIYFPDKNITVSANFTPASSGSYSISGKLHGDFKKNITICLKNIVIGSIYTSTDENGNYYFSDLTNDTYDVYINNFQNIKQFNEFSPKKIEITISGSNVDNVDFYTIYAGTNASGYISNNDKVPVEGVKIIVDNLYATQTNSNGFYKISGLDKGIHFVMPSSDSLTFTPSQKEIMIDKYPLDSLNFTANPITLYNITVNNGTGSGDYPFSASVSISADIPSGMKFKEWTGDTLYLKEINSPTTTLTVPDKDISLTAVFETTTKFYQISGTITGDIKQGITVTVDATHSATTDASGNYTIANLTNNTYTVIPSLDGFTFAPNEQTVTISGADLNNVDFSASKITFALTVVNGTGSGDYAENSSITISADVPNGKIFSSWTGDTSYLDNPNSSTSTLTMPAKNITLTATFEDAPANSHSISGTVSGDVKQGVTVSVDENHSVLTDENGNYIINGLLDNTYTVIPSLDGFTFTPNEETVTISGADVNDIDFSASKITFALTVVNGTGSGDYAENSSITISADVPNGKIFSSWTGDTSYLDHPNSPTSTLTMPAKNITLTATFEDAPANSHSISGTVSGDVKQGVTVSVDENHSDVTNTNGFFTIGGLTDKTYNVTPSLNGYSFTPEQQTVTMAGADITEVNFTALATTSKTPVAVDDSYKIETGRTLSVKPDSGVLSNDLSMTGNELTAKISKNVTHGELEMNDDGSFTYTPAPGFSGEDSFSYFAVDNTEQSDTPATVTISVSIQKVTIGVVVTVLPSQITELLPGSKFDKIPKIYAVQNEKKIGMKKVKESTVDAISAVWKKKIPLHGKIKSNYAATINSLTQDLEIQLKVKGKVDGEKIDYNAQKVLLVPPEILNYSIVENTITINGLFFGTKPPKVMLEPIPEGKIVKCKVDKKNYSFDPKTGQSSITASFKFKKITQGNYHIIVDNKIGIGVITNKDETLSIPIITINPPPEP